MLLQMIVAGVILGVVYVRMLRRETPKPVGRAQAAVPVALGVASTLVGLMITLGFGVLVSVTIGSLNAIISSPAAAALARALLVAGLPEETAKLLMMLLCVRIFRPKNVYEYILIGAGVGVGFTAHEEVAYAGSAAGLARMIPLALHMVFGVIMARHLGLARYEKRRGGTGAARERALALAVPIAVHTVYDACTVFNPAVKAVENGETDEDLALIAGCAAVLIAAVAQFVVLLRVKARSADYCGMRTEEDTPAAA